MGKIILLPNVAIYAVRKTIADDFSIEAIFQHRSYAEINDEFFCCKLIMIIIIIFDKSHRKSHLDYDNDFINLIVNLFKSFGKDGAQG